MPPPSPPSPAVPSGPPSSEVDDEYEREIVRFDYGLEALHVALGIVVIALSLLAGYLLWMALR